MYRRRHIQQLRNNQRSKRNRHNPHKRLFKQHQRQHHNHHALIYTDPQPHEESTDVEVAGFPQSYVEVGVEKGFLEGDVLVEDYGEDGQAGVEGRVAEHEHAVVDGDGDVVEDYGEGHLEDADYEAAVDYELAESGGSLIGVPAMP
jgi:hypothetical protein